MGMNMMDNNIGMKMMMKMMDEMISKNTTENQMSNIESTGMQNPIFRKLQNNENK